MSILIVDEASMVGDREVRGDVIRFGSGRLLKDLVAFARSRRRMGSGDRLVKLLFVGDLAQLPPVGEDESPALSSQRLEAEFGLTVSTFQLETVMRQREGSAILERATEIGRRSPPTSSTPSRWSRMARRSSKSSPRSHSTSRAECAIARLERGRCPVQRRRARIQSRHPRATLGRCVGPCASRRYTVGIATPTWSPCVTAI